MSFLSNPNALNLIGAALAICGLLLALISHIRYDRGREELLRITESLTESEADARRKILQAKNDVEAAQQKNAAMSAFLANINHSIRTSMNGVIGLTTALHETTDLNQRQTEIVDTIQSSGAAMMNILGDILDYTKIESGVLELDVNRVNLRHIVEDVTCLLAEQAREKNLDIYVHYAPDAAEFIETDSGRIRQVLTNLVENAIKFTPSGHVIISANVTQNRAQPSSGLTRNATLKIEVLDTGVGLSETEQSRIFEDFTQLDSSRSKRHSGSGLGLSMARKIVEVMDGKLSVSSKKGEGSVFRFELPVGLAQENFVPPPPIFKSGRVLIVDERPVSLKMLSAQMKAWGLTPTVARSASSAISGILYGAQTDSPFDAVIIDQGCARNAAGTESFAALLKRESMSAQTPTILLSSLTERDAEDSAEYTYCVNKPIVSQPLMQALKSALPKSCLLGRAQSQKDKQAKPEPSETRRDAKSDVVTDESQSARPTTKRVRPIAVADAPKRISRRILLAESNPATRHVMQTFLNDPTIQLHCVEDGEAALASAKTIDFDLILIDAQLRKLDGFLTTRAIRGHEKEAGVPRTPIICLSPYKLGADEELALAIGMDDFLVKPLTGNALDVIVKKWGHIKSEAAAVKSAKLKPVKQDPMMAPLQPALIQKAS